MGLDFIELSGGSYEAPAMQGRSGDERTLAPRSLFSNVVQNRLQSTAVFQ